jgi:hypothetical protein
MYQMLIEIDRLGKPIAGIQLSYLHEEVHIAPELIGVGA